MLLRMTEPGTSSAATAPQAVAPAAPRAAKRNSRLPSLDGMRGLAALIVVVHHCALTLPSLARQYQGPDRSGASFWLTYSPLHTSELQSPVHLVCRLLLEQKNTSCTTTPPSRHSPPPRQPRTHSPSWTRPRT